jgi:hypothetical protein
VEHDNPAMTASVLQAIEELARTSRTSTTLQDELLAENTIRLGFWKPETGSLANSASPAEVARAKSNQQNLSVSNDGD